MKIIKNKQEFEDLVDRIRQEIFWYERNRNFKEISFSLSLANGDNTEIYFDKNNIAHLLGIDTDYLRSTGMFKGMSSYEILKNICDDSYRIYKMVSQGHITYSNFISDYADLKIDNFRSNCGIDFNEIEFICKYKKENSYITGYAQLEGDYYIAYRRNNGLLVLGVKQNGRFYYPMTSVFLDMNEEKSIDYLKKLLTNQVVTYAQSCHLKNLNTGDTGKGLFCFFETKAKNIKILNQYKKEYDCTISIEKDTSYILEKMNKFYQEQDTRDQLLKKISACMKSKVLININELEEEFGELSTGICTLINSYNSSIENGIDAALDEYTKGVVEERDKIKEQLSSVLEDVQSLKQKIDEQNKQIVSLQKENTIYKKREEGIKRILGV